MNKVICLKTDGGIRSFEIDHKKVNLFFDNNEYGICGAIDEHFVIGLGSTHDVKEENAFSKEYPQYFEKTHGDILLVGSNQHGEACDVNVYAICKLFSKDCIQ